mgnify:CR=1 FL=1
MRTEPESALFLFAHQDDEFGVFEQIFLERQAGRRVRACYFTTGVPPGDSSRRRNQESMQVLGRFGLTPDDVHFAGEEIGIADGRTVERLDSAAEWLAGKLAQESVAAVYAPAWEGGHPDHDGLCAVATAVCDRLSLLPRLRHFHLYNGQGCPGPFFRVLAPLEANGPVTRTSIPWRRRLRYLAECLSYGSQWRSWIGLLPFVALHYLLVGTQTLQPASPHRIGVRPHAGALYYEKRRFAQWESLCTRVQAFLVGWRAKPACAVSDEMQRCDNFRLPDGLAPTQRKP